MKFSNRNLNRHLICIFLLFGALRGFKYLTEFNDIKHNPDDLKKLMSSDVEVNLINTTNYKHQVAGEKPNKIYVANEQESIRQNKVLNLDLQGSRCFWTSDIHDGARLDMTSALMDLGHEVINMGHKRLSSPYPSTIIKMRQPTRSLSPLIDKKTSHSDSFTESDVQQFYEYYRNDPDLIDTDAFLCQFPASFCELYMPFNRSIFIIAAHRFFLGRCQISQSLKLIENVIKIAEKQEPKSFIMADNIYDAEYIRHFTGINAEVIPSLTTNYILKENALYNPVRNEILIGPLQTSQSPHAVILNKKYYPKWQFKAVKELYPYFSVRDLCNHRAIVLFPYAVHSYGIDEVWALAIPMFVPSITFMLDHNLLIDKNVNDPFYCGNSFQVPPKHPSSPHPYCPEDRSREAQAYWLKFVSFLTFPHVQVFESLHHLGELLDKSDFQKIHEQMKENVSEYQFKRFIQLQSYVQSVQKHREVPHSWNEALAMWKTKSFVV